MWPAENTFVLLIFGLLPLLYVIASGIKHGVGAFADLRFASILFIWVGYHLSPWLSYFSGNLWENYLLVPQYINETILFTSLCSIAILVGYSRVFRRDSLQTKRQIADLFVVPRVRPSWVLSLGVIVCVLTVVTVGGFDELWASKYARGYGQFQERNVSGALMRMLKVARLPLEILLSVMGSLLILNKRMSFSMRLLGLIALAVASMSSIWVFSRAAGFPFILLGFISIRTRGWRGCAIGVPAIIFAIYLGSIGYGERGLFKPGIGNFIEASYSSSAGSIGAYEKNVSVFENPLDAMPAFTRKAQAKVAEQPDISEMGFKFFWNLNPLPSEMFPIYQLGAGLSTIMGTIGHTGLTTPALAELYYVYGFIGVLLCLPLGAIYGLVERFSYKNPSVSSSAVVILVFISNAVGLHSSMRAMTRPMIYSAIIILIIQYINRRNGNRRKHNVSRELEVM